MSNFDVIDIEEDEFNSIYSDKLEEIKKKKLENMEPGTDEIKKVYDIVLKYVKEKKRKIYGGYALNELLKYKDPSSEIYSSDEDVENKQT